MFANFIKVVEKFEGIWEQIYSYYNISIWYANKTYYQKAVKAFSYCLELITSHKGNKEAYENTAVLRGDICFNSALCKFAID
jgi:hypothetical protein